MILIPLRSREDGLAYATLAVRDDEIELELLSKTPDGETHQRFYILIDPARFETFLQAGRDVLETHRLIEEARS